MKTHTSRLACSFLLALSGLVSTQPCRADVPPSRFEKNSGNATIQKPADDKAAGEARAEADFLKEVKAGVQITELGCMRATFVFDENAEAFETRVTEAFSDADFRVFSKGSVIDGRVEPKALQDIGNDRLADLVVYTKVSGREKPKLGKLSLYEAEATVQVYNPMSEELLVSQTVRKDGERHIDPEVALRSAFESAVDAAVKEVIVKTLEKAHKILVHEAQLKGVQDHQHLLQIMEYTAKLKGVYHVRQLTYDKATKLAVIEIIGAPQTESFWRAYMENLPKHEKWIINVKHIRIVQNEKLRQKNKDWMK
ncbi:hypothetical protein [Prosthecobacter sp.]|uniref:hypothetical protein n=1 Tax=Prosthecobacter sp. TaxID=1965333 RepID=UPI003782EA71